jgi:hypothetical protein
MGCQRQCGCRLTGQKGSKDEEEKPAPNTPACYGAVRANVSIPALAQTLGV